MTPWRLINDSAVKVLGDENLQKIARELVDAVRKNVFIDCAVKKSARAKLRVIVRRLLRRYGYPPDKQLRPCLAIPRALRDAQPSKSFSPEKYKQESDDLICSRNSGST
ncbi:Uncharacterised protein [uncultured archaeon]|nr:Uncharacterised protein [uncultured archaeon]